MPKDSASLSTAERLALIQTLNSLPAAQVAELVFELNPLSGNLPDRAASAASQVMALLEWVESPIGPGLLALREMLDVLLRPTGGDLGSATDGISGGTTGKVTGAAVGTVVGMGRLTRG